MLQMPRTRRANPDRLPATMVAVEVMVLRPFEASGPPARMTAPWPVLAVVLDEPNEVTEPSVRPLFELLDQPARRGWVNAVVGRCQWSAVGPTRSVIQLAVHATAPVRFDLNVLMPVQAVLGFVDLLAGRATIALTNRRHASRLTERIPVRDALAELVLVGSSPSADLAALTGAG